MKTTGNFRAGAAESCSTRKAQQELTPRCGPIGPLEAQRQFSAPPAPEQPELPEHKRTIGRTRVGTARPTALDLFCCAGGASMGLYRAGFDVTGVDIRPQPRYPFRFVQADALNPPFDLAEFDFIWASPPCQEHTVLRKLQGSRTYQCHIADVRAMLIASGRPFAIENVPAAPLHTTIKLCGTMFDLQTPCGAELRRHRHFETSFAMLEPACRHRASRTITVTGNTPQQNVVRNQVRHTFSVDAARTAMDIDWMTMKGLSQAIPPAYSEFIGRAALESMATKLEAAE